MKLLILAAGYGTRLQVLGKNTPKALLDINGKPLLNYILEKVENLEGLNEVVLVTNDKFAATFKEWAKNQKKFPYHIHIVNDGTQTPEDRLGSIGDIDFTLKQTSIEDDLLVVGGDNLFNYNLDEFIDFAKKKSKAITIGVYDIGSLEEAKKFGVVGLDKSGKIISFEEKPPKPKSGLISMCFYYLPHETLNWIQKYLSEVKKSDTAGDFIRWLYQKNNVYGFKFSGKWYDIGSIEAYREAQESFK